MSDIMPPAAPQSAPQKQEAPSTQTATKTKVSTTVAIGIIAGAALGFAAALAFIGLPKRIAKVCVGGPNQGQLCMSDLQCPKGKCLAPFSTTRPIGTVATQPTTRPTTSPVCQPTLTVVPNTKDADVAAGIVMAGSANNVLAKFVVESKCGNWQIKQLRFKVDNAQALADFSLWRNSEAAPVTSFPIVQQTGNFISITSAGIDVLQGITTFTVKAGLKAVNSGYGSGANVRTTLMSGSGSFEADHVGSPAAIVTDIGGDKAGLDKIVRKSKPTFVFVSNNLGQRLVPGANPFFRLTIAADKSGPVAFKKLTFAVAKNTSAVFKLVAGLGKSGLVQTGTIPRDIPGSYEIKGENITTAQCISQVGSRGTCLVTVSFEREEVIPAGGFKTYELSAVVGGTLARGDNFTTSVDTNFDNATATGYLALGTLLPPYWMLDMSNDRIPNGVSYRYLWSDLSAARHLPTNSDRSISPFTGSADWTNGQYLMTTPSAYTLAAP